MRFHGSPYRSVPCPPRRCYTATRKYTAVGSKDCLGLQITVARQVVSDISQEYAERLALKLAKCEAEAALSLMLQGLEPGITIAHVGYFYPCAGEFTGIIDEHGNFITNESGIYVSS